MPARLSLAQTTCLALLASIGAPASTTAQPLADGYKQVDTSLQPVDECEVIAKVNGELVLACELLWEANLRIEELKVPREHQDDARRQLMQQLLMQKLDLLMLYSDFRRTVPQADLEKIHESLTKPFEEQELPKLMKQVGAEDQRELQRRLVQLGTSLRERREDFFRMMIARSWAQEGLTFSREVTHQQLLDYYHKTAEKYDYPTQAKWEELAVNFGSYPTKSDAYRAIAGIGNQAFRLVRQQADPAAPAFTELAKSSSQGITAKEGGQHDWTSQGALAAERVDEALFTLPPGQMSPILESSTGFHIVRVLERKEAGRTPFTEVQTEIREKIIDQRFTVAVNEKMKKLKAKSHVWTVYTGDLDNPKLAKQPGAAR